MGAILSRGGRSGIEEAELASSGAYRYPPKNGANFFSNHFIMGGEKFESPQPESFLFGENSDLNFLGSKPIPFPYPPPQANEPTKTLKSLMNIRKDSMHFVPVENENESVSPEHRKYNIEFTFDSDVRCAITIHNFASEEITPQGAIYSPKLKSETFRYKRGLNQVFSQPGYVFQPGLYPEESLTFTLNAEGVMNFDVVPVAIQCVSEEGEDPKQSHTTIAIVEKQSGDGSYVIKACKQKLFVDGLCYLLQEIYGLENKVMDKFSAEDDLDDCGAECVVCMCDMRDTIILPCRHLCLCNACADSLRYQANNCPICRAPFRALLQIRAVQKVMNGSHPAMAAAIEEGIPPGYQSVSLAEALNGPMIPLPPAPPLLLPPVATATATTAPVCTLTNSETPSSSASTSAKKPRSRKRSSHRSASVAAATAAAPSAASSRSAPLPVPQEDETLQAAASVAAPVNLRGSSVSLKIVDETAKLATSPTMTTTTVVASTSPSLPPAERSDSPQGTDDLVEEELAQMSLMEKKEEEKKKNEAPKPTLAVEEEIDDEDEDDDDDDDGVGDRVVVRSRISLPGTPTSCISVRSSQESSSTSSSASTKQLLGGGAVSNATSAGRVKIVNVKSRSKEVREEDEDDDEEDA